MQAYRSHGATVDIMTELVTARHTKMVIIGHGNDHEPLYKSRTCIFKCNSNTFSL